MAYSLHTAVVREDRPTARRLVSRGVDPGTQTGPAGSSVLFDAVNKHGCEWLSLVLEQTEDGQREELANSTLYSGWSLLMEACKVGNVAAVEKLIDMGARINKKMPRTGWTALHETCRRGHYAAATLLVCAGAYCKGRAQSGSRGQFGHPLAHVPLDRAVRSRFAMLLSGRARRCHTKKCIDCEMATSDDSEDSSDDDRQL